MIMSAVDTPRSKAGHSPIPLDLTTPLVNTVKRAWGLGSAPPTNLSLDEYDRIEYDGLPVAVNVTLRQPLSPDDNYRTKQNGRRSRGQARLLLG